MRNIGRSGGGRDDYQLLSGRSVAVQAGRSDGRPTTHHARFRGRPWNPSRTRSHIFDEGRDYVLGSRKFWTRAFSGRFIYLAGVNMRVGWFKEKEKNDDARYRSKALLFLLPTLFLSFLYPSLSAVFLNLLLSSIIFFLLPRSITPFFLFFSLSHCSQFIVLWNAPTFYWQPSSWRADQFK